MSLSKKPKVATMQAFLTAGPWLTKSNGALRVLLAASIESSFNGFLEHDQKELAKIPADIRGFRIYTVRNLPKKAIGGTEFHRCRKEFFFGLDGSINLICDDLYGFTKTFYLNSVTGVFIPPYIRHSYKVLVENSGFLVIANTLFNPQDTRTHDTYSSEEFESLKKEYKK